MVTRARQAARLVTVLLAALFLVSSFLNLGAKVSLGFGELSFSSPSASIAEFEVVIGLVLLAGAAVSLLYPYGGVYLLASVGIVSGLLSPGVQGLARSLHEAMVPTAIVGWVLIGFEARGAYKSGPHGASSRGGRDMVTALQFFVGGLVTLGGAAYAKGGTYPLGTALGSIHLAVGLAGLLGGYGFLRRKAWSRQFLLGINGVTIVYSAFSESLAQIYALLPTGIDDSLIGTVIAMLVSSAIIYLLMSKFLNGAGGDEPRREMVVLDHSRQARPRRAVGGRMLPPR